MLLMVMIALLADGCHWASDATPRTKVTVLAAASTRDAMAEVARLFEERTEIEITISTGPSNGLAQQIRAGAPADVFLSANKQWAEAVDAAGLARETVDLLTNRLVLIVPQGNPAAVGGPDDLTSPEVTRVAIAGENVPAGIYAEQALRSLELFDELEKSGRLARGSDVRVTLAYVDRAEAEAGIVYATDARVSSKVEVVADLDPAKYDPVIYPVVLLERAANDPAARRFFVFLQSEEALLVFERHGFARR